MNDVQLDTVPTDEIFPEQSTLIETTLEEFDMNVEKAKKLFRLLDNQDFIDIITEGYIEKDAERLGGLLTTSNKKVEEKTEQIVEMLIAKRYLRKWIKYKTAELGNYLVEGQREALVKELEEMEAELEEENNA